MPLVFYDRIPTRRDRIKAWFTHRRGRITRDENLSRWARWNLLESERKGRR